MSYKTNFFAAASVAFFITSCSSADRESPKNTGYNPAPIDPSTAVVESSDATKDQLAWANYEPAGNANNKIVNSEYRFGDSIAKVVQTTAAELTILDSTHMFIRTADVRCRVSEVANSTYEVEDAVKQLGGYISDTKLSSTQTWQQQIPISKDSLQQITKFSVVNTITIRVPAKNLDSLLRSLVPLVQYMDYRNVNVNDITLEQLSNQMEQTRLAKYNAMIQSKVVDQTNKADKIMVAAEAMLEKQTRSDNAYLESLRLTDRVLYATLNLQIYQPEKTASAILYREKPIEPYNEGIGSRLSSSLYAGWNGFSYLLSGIALLWPLWFIACAAWLIIRWQLKKKVKVA